MTIRLRCTGYLLLAPRMSSPNVLAAAGQLSTNSTVLVLAGSADCVYPSRSNALPVYAAVPVGGCKTYIEFVGGNSCQFNNPQPLPVPPRPGVTTCLTREVTCGAQFQFTPQQHVQLTQLLGASSPYTAQMAVNWMGNNVATDAAGTTVQHLLSQSRVVTMTVLNQHAALQTVVMSWLRGFFFSGFFAARTWQPFYNLLNASPPASAHNATTFYMNCRNFTYVR